MLVPVVSKLYKQNNHPPSEEKSVKEWFVQNETS